MTLGLTMDSQRYDKIPQKKKCETEEKQIKWTSSQSKLGFRDHQESENHPQNRKEIFANHISDKGLVYRIYKEFLYVKTKKTNDTIFKCAKEWNIHFSKEDI